MKRTTAIIVAGALCAFGIGVGAAASEVIESIRAELRPDFKVEIDGKLQQFKNADGDVVYPILYEGTTYLPLRAIGELMGKTVYWFEDEKRIELREEKTTVTDADVIVTENKDTEKSDKKTEKPKDVKVQDTRDKAKEASVDLSGFIGEEKAKEAALARAGLDVSEVIFDRVELDRDDGIYVYEVDFRSGRTEYDTEVSATDGRIVGWDVEIDD